MLKIQHNEVGRAPHNIRVGYVMLSMAKLREEHNSDRGLIPLKKIFNEILRKKREKVRKKIHKQKPHTHTHKLAQHSWHQDPRKEKCYKAKKGDWTCDRNQCLTPKPPGPQCPGCQEIYGSLETHCYCSTCFPAKFPEEFQQQEAERQAKAGPKYPPDSPPYRFQKDFIGEQGCRGTKGLGVLGKNLIDLLNAHSVRVLRLF